MNEDDYWAWRDVGKRALDALNTQDDGNGTSAPDENLNNYLIFGDEEEHTRSISPSKSPRLTSNKLKH